MKVRGQLRNLIPGVVTLSILVSVATIGYLGYKDLRQVILDGFDRKLEAISVVTAAFVDAEDHERILAPRQIIAAAKLPAGDLLAIDTSLAATNLVRINSETGEAADLQTNLTETPVSITVSKSGRCFGLVPPRLVEIDPETGRISDQFKVLGEFQAVSFDSSGEALFAGGPNGLYKIDLQTGETSAVQYATDWNIAELAAGSAPGEWLIFDGTRLIRANAETWQPLELEISGIHALTSDFAASDRLIDIKSGDPGVAGFRSESSDLYLRYAEPMRAIKSKTELTFLYTQTLAAGNEVTWDGALRDWSDPTDINRIIYILDSNTDDDHTEIGYFEPEDKADESIRDVFFKGRIHLSDVEDWERWGLIKSGFAPMYDQHGRILAMAGADVNVQKIKERTKQVMARIVFTSLAALIPALWISMLVARRLVRPINDLRDVSLQIAAGEYGAESRTASLREFRILGESFNQLSRKIRSTVVSLARTNEDWEISRCRQVLVQSFSADPRVLEEAGLLISPENTFAVVAGDFVAIPIAREDSDLSRAGALLRQLLPNWTSDHFALLEEDLCAMLVVHPATAKAWFANWSSARLSGGETDLTESGSVFLKESEVYLLEEADTRITLRLQEVKGGSE